MTGENASKCSCGRPATWLASAVGRVRPGQPFVQAFCDDCRQINMMAQNFGRWETIARPAMDASNAAHAWDDFAAQVERGPQGKEDDHG